MPAAIYNEICVYIGTDRPNNFNRIFCYDHRFSLSKTLRPTTIDELLFCTLNWMQMEFERKTTKPHAIVIVSRCWTRQTSRSHFIWIFQIETNANGKMKLKKNLLEQRTIIIISASFRPKHEPSSCNLNSFFEYYEWNIFGSFSIN